MNQHTYVSRGGEKLEAALRQFRVDVAGLSCADLGSNVGGFVDCLLRHNAARVYSIDTSYGTLAWKLRRDPRVVVMERTNALHAKLPEPVQLVTIDVGWTKQSRILPQAATMLAAGGRVVSLIKPHYEAPHCLLRHGVLPDEAIDEVLRTVQGQITGLGWSVTDLMPSPIRGQGGNQEFLALLVG